MLLEVLTWVVSGGGAAVVAYALMEKVAFLVNLQAEAKRYVSYVLTAAIAMGVYAGSIGLKYVPLPVGWQSWLEVMFEVGAISVGLGQVLHARKQLSKRS